MTRSDRSGKGLHKVSGLSDLLQVRTGGPDIHTHQCVLCLATDVFFVTRTVSPLCGPGLEEGSGPSVIVVTGLP